MPTATTSELVRLFEQGEDELVERVLAYARRQDYTRYTTPLQAAWRASVAGLTQALVRTLSGSADVPEFRPDDDVTRDPCCAFGILEAQRHRARGIDLELFLGLMKYYEQSFLDLLEASALPAATKGFGTLFVRRFFDRVEMGFSLEWLRTSELDRLEELRRANRELAEEKSLYLTIFESAGLPLLLIDEEGRVRNLNFAAAQLFHGSLTPGAFYYRKDQQGPPPWLAEDLESFRAARDAERVFERDLAARGETRRFEVRLRRTLDVSGRFAGFTVSLQDVTARAEVERVLSEARDGLEQRVQARTRQLDQALEALRGEMRQRAQAEEERRRLEAQVLQSQKLESLGVLAGGIAHDFNNLLTAIVGNADLARLALPRESPALEPLDDVGRAADRAAELCRQMLAYAGRGRLERRRVPLRELIEEMTALLGVAVPKNVRLETSVGHDEPATEGDASQLRQVLLNLVTNAAEAIGEREGTVFVSARSDVFDRARLDRMELGRALAPGRYVVLSVVDEGCGMRPEVRARIFEPFYSTKFTGRGLGLATVFGIVRGHGGALDIETAEGRGSSFRVLLPLAPALPARAEIAPGGVEDGPPAAGGTVLVVDDEPSVLGVGRALLQRDGFTVLTAGDGEAALDVVDQVGPGLRVVLLDLTMPRRDGLSTLTALRERRPDLPVVLTSGYDHVDVAESVSGLPRVTVLQKPFGRARLRAALRRVL